MWIVDRCFYTIEVILLCSWTCDDVSTTNVVLWKGYCVVTLSVAKYQRMYTLIARFMGPTWWPRGADRTQVGPMLATWTLLSGYHFAKTIKNMILVVNHLRRLLNCFNRHELTYFLSYIQHMIYHIIAKNCSLVDIWPLRYMKRTNHENAQQKTVCKTRLILFSTQYFNDTNTCIHMFINTYSISQEICTWFLLFLLWLYIDWFSHVHQAYFTGTVAI